MSITLQDIAEKAGVSKTTVSRVLNNKESEIPIRKETKRKVLKAAEDLNYRPNVHARALSTKKSYMLAFMVDYLDPFYNDIIKGIENYSREKNYNLILSIANEKPLDKIINVLLNQSSVEGIIIGGTKKLIKDESIVTELNKKNVPVVLLAHYLNGTPSVNVDNFKGAYIATNYLVGLGYTDIGIITGSDLEGRKDTKERFAGYKQVLRDNSIKINEKYIIEGDFTYQSGYLAMKKFLNLNTVPEAVFACDDQMALGSLSAANECNVKVPEDISIIGFDDIIQTKYSSPKLTTIAQPKIKMGESATQMLISLIEKKEIKEKIKVFPPKLVKRNSCKRKFSVN